MKFITTLYSVCMIATILVPLASIAEAAETCQVQAQNIKAATKSCQDGFEKDGYNEILSQIASATLTVADLETYSAANCAKIDDITQCVIEKKAELADSSCSTDSVYNHAIFTLNHVIRLNSFICAKKNGEHLLKAMIPDDGLKCFYGNPKYVNCVQNSESNSVLPDICANIDVRLNCLNAVNDCRNDKAVEAFRNLFLNYKERIIC